MSESGAARPHRRWRPLVALEAATLLSATGNGVALVALPWVVLELTGSAADVGLVAAVAALPLVLSAFVAGTIVDRFGRRRTALASDVLSGLSIAAIPVAAMLDVLSLGLLVVLAALGATFDPAGVTARETMLPEAADRRAFGASVSTACTRPSSASRSSSAPRSAASSSPGSAPRRRSGRRPPDSRLRRSRPGSCASRARVARGPRSDSVRSGRTASTASRSSGTTGRSAP